jgi:hypothetical protein
MVTYWGVLCSSLLLAAQGPAPDSKNPPTAPQESGAINSLTLISGEPSLAKAAIKAVRQWKYKPFFLEGKPVEVETQIQVNFALSG